MMRIRHKLTVTTAAMVLLATTAFAQTAETTNDPLASVKERIAALETRITELNASKQRIERLEKSIADINARLGRTLSQPTSFNSVERRIDQLERDLDQLKRRVDRLDRR